MNLTEKNKQLIVRVVNVFETGKAAGDYAAIAIYADGPNDVRQITYGRSQTTEYGNLRLLVQRYVEANGIYSAALAPFVADIGRRPLTDDRTFVSILLRAGRCDPVMHAVQDAFFEERYFVPAMRWAGNHGLALPLSALVVYDSYVHSGSILRAIRLAFAHKPPSSDGEERAWTTAYVNARHHFLGTHRRPAVRKTVYRTSWFAGEIARGNWNLDLLPLRVNGVGV